MQKVMFGAGCFWGVESAFRTLPGVLDAVCGYSGGTTVGPTYEQVCSGRTGHAEVVEVTFDHEQLSFEQLVRAFFEMHNPTTPNRQGPDVGTQYRSAIFTYDDSQAATATQIKAELNASGQFPRPIVTEVTPAQPFYRAEEYHQRYFEKHGGASCHI